MGEVQTGNGTSETGDPEKKRRIACDYPGMKSPVCLNLHPKTKLTRLVLGCDKSFLR